MARPFSLGDKLSPFWATAFGVAVVLGDYNSRRERWKSVDEAYRIMNSWVLVNEQAVRTFHSSSMSTDTLCCWP